MVDKDEFEAVGVMLRKQAPQTLKAYPHVIERLHWLWSSPADCRAYLQKILMNESGTRGGFPVEVMAELLTINHLYERRHPNTLEGCEAWSLLDPRLKRGQSVAAKTRATTTVYVKPDPRDWREKPKPGE